MRVVAGTYEGFCYGWDTKMEGEGGDRCDSAAAPLEAKDMSLSFGYNVHVGCIKSVALATSGTRAGSLLVTGGADERVRIYDTEKRMEIGELQQHNGSITCMEFYKSTHLLTGSDDQTICIWRVHDWALLHVLGGHKGPVTSISIHPSGRMALSVSRDRTMRLWNLLEGRCAYIKRLQGEGELVRWSASGDSFFTVVRDRVMVTLADTSKVLGECIHPMRVNGACFVRVPGGQGGKEGSAEANTEEVLATCSEDGKMRFFSLGGELLDAQELGTGTAGGGRTRDMCFVPLGPGGSSNGGVITVTSTGGVNLWRIPPLTTPCAGGAAGGEGGAREGALLWSHTVKGEPRFTCVTAVTSHGINAHPRGFPAPSKNSKKRKKMGGGRKVAGDNRSVGQVETVGGDGPSARKKKKRKKSKEAIGLKGTEGEMEAEGEGGRGGESRETGIKAMNSVARHDEAGEGKSVVDRGVSKPKGSGKRSHISSGGGKSNASTVAGAGIGVLKGNGEHLAGEGGGATPGKVKQNGHEGGKGKKSKGGGGAVVLGEGKKKGGKVKRKRDGKRSRNQAG